jgi:hypothetical protein
VISRGGIVVTAIGIAVLSGAAPAAGDPPASVSTYSFARADERLCISPVCGGLWVSRVNARKTACGDGVAKRTCYAAEADLSRTQTGKKERVRLKQQIAEGRALVRGRLVRGRVDGFPRLDALVVTEVWTVSTSSNRARGTFYKLRDRGIRCVTTPCFSIHAAVLNSGRHLDISDVDLTPTRVDAVELGRAMKQIGSRGLVVAGRVVPDPDAGPAGDGRELVVTQFYVRAG